jgi:hypothetical protein
LVVEDDPARLYLHLPLPPTPAGLLVERDARALIFLFPDTGPGLLVG